MYLQGKFSSASENVDGVLYMLSQLTSPQIGLSETDFEHLLLQNQINVTETATSVESADFVDSAHKAALGRIPHSKSDGSISAKLKLSSLKPLSTYKRIPSRGIFNVTRYLESKILLVFPKYPPSDQTRSYTRDPLV